MFQARPEIHCDRPYLDLDANLLFASGEKDRDFHNQMQTAVAVILRRFDIVLPGDQQDVVLFEQHVRHVVYIADKGADNAYAGHIVQVCRNGLYRYGLPLFAEFFRNAVRTFHP